MEKTYSTNGIKTNSSYAKSTATKLTVTPKTVTGLLLLLKRHSNSHLKLPLVALYTLTPVEKPMPNVTTINVLDDEEVVIVTEDDGVTLIEDEFGNLFQDTFEDELGTE